MWWRQTVTSDPKLEFTRFHRVNRVEHDATGNEEGITHDAMGTQYDVAFASKSRIFVYVGLRNGGSRTVQIENVLASGFYYFGFDTMEVSPDRDAAIGAKTTYEPFKPFTLKAGEDRNVRLTFRMADCSPSTTGLQPGITRVQGLLMRYKLLGLGRTWLVPFRGSVLAVPSVGSCEHPIHDPGTPG